MKAIIFAGSSLADLRDFPEIARSQVGYQLREVQKGFDPHDWKPMKTVGPGVREIRIRDASGAFRVIYLAAMDDVIVVLHAFQKKTQATAQKDIDLAATRLRAWKG
jgi:phage-related protein